MFKNIGPFAYKIQTGQRLNNRDKQARVAYRASVLVMVYNNPKFLSNVRFSDGSHIHLNGFVNEQTTEKEHCSLYHMHLCMPLFLRAQAYDVQF